MNQITIQITVEELFDPNSDISAEADLSVTLTLDPPERATRNYPGHPGVVEQVGVDIDGYCLYDEFGNELAEGNMSRTPKWLLKAIDGWCEENDQLLVDLACEEETERSYDF